MSPAGPLTLAIHDGIGQRLELLAVQLAVQARARITGLGKRDLAALLDRTCRSNTQQRAFELGSARERRTDGLVPLPGEQQRQRRGSLTEVGAGDLPGLDRDPRAVEDVIGDLEGDSECEPERPGATGQAACRLEQFSRLQRATFEIRADTGIRIEALRTLHRFTAREAER